MDNVLGNDIGRSCLCSKDHGDRCLRFVSGLDVEIFVDHIECIHLLTLVLMQSLYLHIKDGIGIDGNTLFFPDI